MTRGLLRTLKPFLAIALLLASLGEVRASAAQGATAQPEEVFSSGMPSPTHQVWPEYPDSLRRAEVSGLVIVHVLVSESGSVERAVCSTPAAPAPLVALALAAANGWRFEPALSDGKPTRVWVPLRFRFDPERGTTEPRPLRAAELLASEASAAGVTAPIPLVRTPLVTAADGIDPAGPPFLGVLSVRVGSDGFAKEATLDGAPSRTASAIEARAKRWVWEPGRDAAGAPVEAWTTVRVKARPEAVLIDRPDSTMGEILGAANFANVKVVDKSGKGAQRDMNPLQLAHVFADWISEDKAYAGDDPWKTHRPVRFDARIEFDGPGGTLHADLARDIAWMQVTTRDRVLFVPYGPIRARIDEAFAKLFPDSSMNRAKH